MTKRVIVVLGVMAGNPYAGIAWQCLQYLIGLRRLGHEVYYFEVSSVWPYDPNRRSPVDDSAYPLSYLQRLAADFDFRGRWAYRRSYSDGEWFGLPRTRAEAILREADAVLNISGATDVRAEGLSENLILVGTDPVVEEARLAAGIEDTACHISAHRASFTFGENIGTDRSPVPAFPNLAGTTRQPVVLDFWGPQGAPSRDVFTTVGNWHQEGTEIAFGGETYFWSKDREFLRFVDLPRRLGMQIELATTLDPSGELESPGNGSLPAGAGTPREVLESHGWRLIDALALTGDPWSYRDYIRASKGEFTVAKDANVRLRTGWFSDRSASYLAAGRPVITQDTGFGDVLPTGRGLFAFRCMEDILAAFAAIQADYAEHSRAARDIAQQYFRAETVLSRMLADAGL